MHSNPDTTQNITPNVSTYPSPRTSFSVSPWAWSWLSKLTNSLSLNLCRIAWRFLSRLKACLAARSALFPLWFVCQWSWPFFFLGISTSNSLRNLKPKSSKTNRKEKTCLSSYAYIDTQYLCFDVRRISDVFINVNHSILDVNRYRDTWTNTRTDIRTVIRLALQSIWTTQSTWAECNTKDWKTDKNRRTRSIAPAVAVTRQCCCYCLLSLVVGERALIDVKHPWAPGHCRGRMKSVVCVARE